MTRQILKPITIGILIGAALFIMPFFLLRAIVFFLIIGALLRLFRGSVFRRRHNPGLHPGTGLHPAFADVIHYMNEEEYRVFREKLESAYHGHYNHNNEVYD